MVINYRRHDFVVKHDATTEDGKALSRKILKSLVLHRIKKKKPVVIFISGDSGEGKSTAGLKLQEVLSELQGFDLEPFLDDINVYTPLEYPTKIRALLHEERLKKVNIICVHEAREVVKAKNWQSFLVQAIADINAMSRSIKRLVIIIISQFIRDITTDIRYTLNYYVKVYRPMGHAPAEMFWWVMWKDDSDLMNPQLRKRKVNGYVVPPVGRARHIAPDYLTFGQPPRSIVEKFEESDLKAKKHIIEHKLDKLIKEMSIDAGGIEPKLKALADYYTQDTDMFMSIAKLRKNGLAIKPSVIKVHELKVEDAKQFKQILYDAAKDKGLIGDEPL